MTPTPQQLAACTHVRESPNHLAVRARAGTGKTKLLVDMTKQCSSRERTLAVAFNKSIREELETRVPKYVDVKTLHGLGFGAIQRVWGNLSVDNQRQRALAQSVVPESREWTRRTVISTVCRLVSMCMTQLATTVEEVTETMYSYAVLPDRGVLPEQLVSWAVQVLALSRLKTTAISFDDQVFLPAIEDIQVGAYHTVLLDEAQDTNPAGVRLVMNSIKRGGKIVIVGDDRQSIYGWRGAGADAFDALVKRLEADVLPLTWTFRCPTRVVTLARTLVPDLEAAPGSPRGRVTWDSESSFYDHVAPGDAVIARSNAALTKACMQLLKRGVRAKIAGRDFGDSLMGIVDRAGTNNVVTFLEWLTPWITAEAERLTAAGKEDKADELADSAEALRVLSEGTRSCTDLNNKLADLFVEAPGLGVVHLSTVHRAKGLQWGRVWVLESSFRINTLEGENLYYVAITRVLGRDAPGELHLVQNALLGGKIPTSIARELLGVEQMEEWGDETDEEGWGDR